MSIMTATMLLFKFEDRKLAAQKALVIAWISLISLNFAIVEYLFGLVLWCSGQQVGNCPD